MRLVAVALVLLALSPSAARADWEVKRSPFDARVVARYKQILHRDPEDADALAKLTALYKHYKSVDELRRELTAAAEKSHDAADWLVAGHVARGRGDFAAAGTAYAAALAAAPDDARALVALADADVRLGKAGEARPLYERALKVADGKRKRPLLRKLAELALQADRDVGAKAALADARRYYDELIKLDPKDDDVRREWAEALAAHGQPGEAAVEWRTLAERLARDPAKQGQAWLRAGELSEAGGDDKAARTAYDKTFALAPRGNYLRREAADKIIGLARKHDELRALAGEWERAWPESSRAFGEWELLARLHDELGDAERAQAAFKQALKLDAHALDARKRLIALYERTGRDVEAIAEYRRLIASAPGETRFRIELAERLMKAGNRDEALKITQALGRESTEPALHAQLADLYTRWNLAELAMREQELLVRIEPDDEGHLVALGELHWQKGNKKKALELWRRIADRSGAAKVAGMTRLAEVYVEHDLAPEALDLYEKANKAAPDNVTVQKGLASTLERLHRDREAEEVWASLFERAAEKRDRPAQLEARQRLLTVAARQGRLGMRAAEYRERAIKERKDEALAAAFRLAAADALVKMGRMEMAEEVLRDIADGAKDPSLRADAWIGMAQVERARRRLPEAVAALKKAAELAPDRGRDLYPQIAELSLQLYQDADALRYAKRAVQLGPADVAAQVRLGEVLEKRDDLDGARVAYERALEIDDRQWKVYFTLARLHLRRGEGERAAPLYRTVMRRAPDEELVIDAARRAIDLEEYLGTLGDLERELSPLAYAHADKPVYRNLLIELYDRYGSPLVLRAQAGDATVQPDLQRLGEHGLRPLLDVLVDGEPAQQRVAVALLGAVGNPSAAPALFKLALSKKVREREDRAAAVELREQAAAAAAEVATVRDLPSLARLMADPEKQLRVAAANGYARLDDKRAQAALVAALDDGAADVQAMACDGLGMFATGKAVDAMIARLRAGDRRPEARIACAYGLATLAVRNPPLSAAERTAIRTALVETLNEGADDVQRAAAFALGEIAPDEARAALIRAVLVKREPVRRAALRALARGHRDDGKHDDGKHDDGKHDDGKHDVSPGVHRLPPARGDDGLDARATLARLGALAIDGPLSFPIGETADLDAVADGLKDALARHRDLVLRALDDLDGAAEPALRILWTRLGPSLRPLGSHADAAVRARLGQLAVRAADAELAAAALADPAESVRLAVLGTLATLPPLPSTARAQLAPAVERALGAPAWRVRRAAAFAAGAHGELWADRGARVLAPLRRDPSGFVREAVR